MPFEIRTATANDAGAISEVILQSLRETNARDYSPEIIARVATSFTPAAVRELIRLRVVFVAITGGLIVGTASLDDHTVRTMFVSPDHQKKGIGRLLMQSVEALARQRHQDHLLVPATVTAQAFYARLGFVAVREAFHGEELTVVMRRSLAGP